MDIKKLMVVTLLMLVVTPTVAHAVFVKENCLNDSYLQLEYDFTMTVEGEAIEYVYTQVFNCTNGCTDDRCNAMNASADMTAMWVTFAAGLAFLLIGTAMGVPFGKIVGKEEITAGWDTTLVVRYMFFFIGFYLVYLSFGMSRRVSAIYGGDANIVSAADTATMVMRITMSLFLLVMFVETLFYILKYYQESGYRNRFE